MEEVTVTAVDAANSTLTAVFTKNHATNALIKAYGIFPQGVLSSSTGTQLRIFGDINGDGTIAYVQYTCDTGAGTLSRSVTTVTPTTSTMTSSQVLVGDITANPGGTPCFQYTSRTAGPYTFVTSVAVTLSARTSSLDPQTGQYGTMTKSFLNLSPRNVLTALSFVLKGYSDRVQNTPPNIPLT